MGVISALVYLHEGTDEHVYSVHGDIKLENILLDANFNAKVSDFSFAKFSAFDDSSFGNVNSLFIFICCGSDTHGHVAPEYISSKHLSYKVDIYSFGILVLRLVSGKRTPDLTDDDDDRNFVTRSWRLYKEDRLDELIHPELLDCEGFELSSIIRSIKIALWCVLRDPFLRTTTSRVSRMLSTEEEIPQLPDDSISMEPHRLEQKGRQSEVEIEEIEEVRA
ncbi:cysteine-rich receptor-like protein kinase 34 [Cryptomeria japonica]|uniref:cysteine-rich receptor-like protein kinase 34 n=1 Tax=Cryptomeria japonica TaxID=3369 RepID=UPI0027DA2251|nr:cysteine-rich receptor-like protein kinase 34 [Cryptomeria japonica]